MAFDFAEVKRDTLATYPFFGSIMAGTEYEASEDMTTAGSDGKTIFYNPEYLESLTRDDRVFVLAHELCHIAFNHIMRSDGKDPFIWKTATDAVINQLLQRDGLKIVRGGVDLPEAIDYDAERLYAELLEDKLEIEMVEGRIDDDHTKWEEAVDQQKQMDREFEDDLLDMFEKMEELSEDQEEEELDLIETTESEAGNAVHPETRAMAEIGHAKPIIDWRVILRDTVNYDVDWSLEHAILEDGIVRPMLEERPMAETEIVLDTSWSVEETLLRNFLQECKNILPYSKLKVGCFDTKFYGFHEIRNEDDIDYMKFEGGGGTDFDVAVDAFSLRVDNRIIFTDGEAPMPEKPLDAVWMVYGEEPIQPKGGKVIFITPEQLAKLEEKAHV